MAKKKMNKKKKQRLIWGSIAASLLMIYLVFAVNLPYYIEFPGGMQDVSTVLRVASEDGSDAQSDQESGSYNYTYVSLGRATAAGLVYAWLTPYTDIYSEAEMTGGSSSQDFDRINQFYMETSQNMAEYQALTLAGKDAQMKYLGVYVLTVAENSTFKGVLNIADTVTGVNGRTFGSSKELIDYVSGLSLDSEVSVTFTSEGQEKTEKGQIVKLENGKNGIGIGLIDHTVVESSHKISYQTEGLGGPSAGLIFTLSIYTQISEPNLRGGRVIAGTGTIEADGSVGDVGGVGKKVISAAESGAEIFFVPNNPVDKELLKAYPDSQSNYEEALEAAKTIDTDMEIVPVQTAQEAIDYLKGRQN